MVCGLNGIRSALPEDKHNRGTIHRGTMFLPVGQEEKREGQEKILEVCKEFMNFIRLNL